MSGLLETIGDAGPNPYDVPRVPAWHTLALIGTCVDTAEHMAERGDIDATDVEDTARVLGYRIMSMADREPRALHTWFHAGRTSGDESPVTAAPDPYTRVRAAVKPTRSNSGRTVNMVTVHGRSMVGGSARFQRSTIIGPVAPNHECAMSADVLAHAIDTAPRTTFGHVDGVALAHLTDIAYPDIPRMVGADVLSFEEFGAWDETRARTPRRGHPTRYRLPTVRVRTGERGAAHELIAPCDTDHVWIGHRRVKRSDTVRTMRARNAKRIDAALLIPTTLPLADGIAAAIASAPSDRPYRMTWEHDGARGAITLSGVKRRRYSVTGLPVKVEGYETIDGLRRAVMAATE